MSQNLSKRRLIQLLVLKEGLERINKILDVIDDFDVYGDIVENFCEEDKTSRHTDRIIEMINKDLKQYNNIPSGKALKKALKLLKDDVLVP